jgi:hypothetical protein
MCVVRRLCKHSGAPLRVASMPITMEETEIEDGGEEHTPGNVLRVLYKVGVERYRSLMNKHPTTG